jgi:hypothetical protein
MLFQIGFSSVTNRAKFEEYFSVPTRSQRMLERLLELLERIHLLDCGGERPISYEVAQFLVNLLDFCAGCVAYPIDEPESVQAETTVVRERAQSPMD